MSASAQTARPVSISYRDLVDREGLESLYPALSAAFGAGPDCLGILVVTDLPGSYPKLRRDALHASSRLASLPESALQRLESPESNYLVGWSHGRERMDGVPDVNKGSFYFNPTHTYDATDGFTTAEPSEYPEYESPNLWPEDLPGFKEAVVTLAEFIVEVGGHVARACDSYVRTIVRDYESDYLESMVKQSRTCKARLLHYFPSRPTVGAAAGKGDRESSAVEVQAWCGKHLDHGCLTGLTSAMYLHEPPFPAAYSDTEDDGGGPCDAWTDADELSASPDPEAGLYIVSRNGTVLRVAVPRDALAFQTGGALQLTTSDALCAVPHFVRGSSVPHVARNTLAVFMQPNLDAVLGPRGGGTFKDFARGVVRANYGLDGKDDRE